MAKENRIHLKVVGDQATVHVNDEQIWQGSWFKTDGTWLEQPRLGIGGQYWYDGVTLRFSDVEIRTFTTARKPQEQSHELGQNEPAASAPQEDRASVQPQLLVSEHARRLRVLERKLRTAREAQEAGADIRAYERFEWLAEHFSDSEPGRAAAQQLRRYQQDQAFMAKLQQHLKKQRARQLLSLGDSYAEAGANERAVEQYRKVIEHAPGSDAAAQAEAALVSLE